MCDFGTLMFIQASQILVNPSGWASKGEFSSYIPLSISFLVFSRPDDGGEEASEPRVFRVAFLLLRYSVDTAVHTTCRRRCSEWRSESRHTGNANFCTIQFGANVTCGDLFNQYSRDKHKNHSTYIFCASFILCNPRL